METTVSAAGFAPIASHFITESSRDLGLPSEVGTLRWIGVLGWLSRDTPVWTFATQFGQTNAKLSHLFADGQALHQTRGTQSPCISSLTSMTSGFGYGTPRR
jgi:hypothetical protein